MNAILSYILISLLTASTAIAQLTIPILPTAQPSVRLMEQAKPFIDQGVPQAALLRALDFINKNGGKAVAVEAKNRNGDGPEMEEIDLTVKTSALAIIDFSQPSSEKRLYILDLNKKTVERYFVSHGRNSGVTEASRFSNIPESKTSSLGFYLGGTMYRGKHDLSMTLHGLEPSNDKAAERDIVMHGADYATEGFMHDTGRLGRSWGCPAVAPQYVGKLTSILKNGGVLLAYHKKLSAEALQSPEIQDLKDGKTQGVDIKGEE